MKSNIQPTTADEELLPISWGTVYRVGLIGVSLSFLSAVVGIASDLAQADSASQARIVIILRLWLAGLGVLLATSAVALRHSSGVPWLILSLSCALSTVGFPEHWDSAWRISYVGCGVAVIGAVIVHLPRRYVFGVLSAGAVVHFGGILSAVTSPPPQPWMTQQIWVRLYRPYLQFVYLNNAYHFYSPEPGPAMQLFFLIEYQADSDNSSGDFQEKVIRFPFNWTMTINEPTGKLPKNERYKWVTTPVRPGEIKDPLMVSYYRRLSLTEQTNQFPNANNLGEESLLVQQRRQERRDIPLHRDFPLNYQYRPPLDAVQRSILPSYARYITLTHTQPGKKVRSVKIYRVEHRVIAPREFSQGVSPYDPLYFLPYFQGEYDPQGELIDTKDPMLYWLVPILAEDQPLTQTGPASTSQTRYIDYLSKHANHQFHWFGMDPKKLYVP